MKRKNEVFQLRKEEAKMSRKVFTKKRKLTSINV